jgi:hypothetical protein
MLATYHKGGGCLLPLLLVLSALFFLFFPLVVYYPCYWIVSLLVPRRFLLPCCRSFVFSHFCWYIYIGGLLVRFLPLRRVTATEFLIDALPALVIVYLLVRGQSWPRLNSLSFWFPCSKFPVRVDALAVWRPLSIMLS